MTFIRFSHRNITLGLVRENQAGEARLRIRSRTPDKLNAPGQLGRGCFRWTGECKQIRCHARRANALAPLGANSPPSLHLTEFRVTGPRQKSSFFDLSARSNRRTLCGSSGRVAEAEKDHQKRGAAVRQRLKTLELVQRVFPLMRSGSLNRMAEATGIAGQQSWLCASRTSRDRPLVRRQIFSDTWTDRSARRNQKRPKSSRLM